jgi:glutaconyl-CoA decarboxylase
VNFDVSVNGKPWKVAIEEAGQAGRYTVTVKGKRREMDAAWIDADTLSLIDTQSGIAREIALTPRGSEVDVAVGGRVYRVVAVNKGQTPVAAQAVLAQAVPAQAVPAQAAPAQAAPAQAAAAQAAPAQQRRRSDPLSVQDGRVTAPMPGRVVRVLVAVGDKVTARQPVVVMEAMKMENELRAGRDGSVAEVLVQEGMAVDTGTILVIVL